MARLKGMSALASLALLGTVATVFSPHVAHAASAQVTPAHYMNGGNGCAVTKVQLNGTQSPSVTCAVAAGQTQPDISGGQQCDGTSVILFQDVGYSGNRICFYGYGTANLGQFWISPAENWNDEVSSFTNGNAFAGNLYTNNDRNGTPFAINFNQGVYDLRPYGYSDVASSICLRGPGVACGNPGSN